MKRFFSYALLFASTLIFTACPNDDEDYNDKWTHFSELQINDIPTLRFTYNDNGTVSEMIYNQNMHYSYAYFPSFIQVYLNDIPKYRCLLNNKIITEIRIGDSETVEWVFKYDINQLSEASEVFWGRKDYMFTWENGNIVKCDSHDRGPEYWMIPNSLPNSASNYLFFNPLVYALKMGLGLGSFSVISDTEGEWVWFLGIINYFGKQPVNLVSGVYSYNVNAFYIDDLSGRSGRTELWEGCEYTFELSNGKISNVNRSEKQRYPDGEFVHDSEIWKGQYRLTWN